MGPNGTTDGFPYQPIRPLQNETRRKSSNGHPMFQLRTVTVWGKGKVKGMQNKPNLIHLPDGCLVFSGFVAKVK